MRSNWGAFVAMALFALVACTDHGATPLGTSTDEGQGAIAFNMLKSQTPADAWVIEARLERDGYPTLKQSAYVRPAPDTIKITMTGIATGYWKVTVDARDSTGNIRYTGTSYVEIIERQTVQTFIQMNSAGTSGNLEIVVSWPSSGSHLIVRTAGSLFRPLQIVPVEITNVSKVSVIPASCCTRPDLRIQQKLNGTWTPPGACELMCPSIILPLKPGQRIVDSALQVPRPGVYRLLLRYMTTTPQGTAQPFETYSNEFTIVGLRKDTIRLGEEFTLKIGEQVSVQGTDLTLTFQDVTEDSRCPLGAMCWWEGNARILLGVNQSTVALNSTLDPKKAIVGNYVIQLNSLSPYPVIDRRVTKEEYVAALIVTGITINEFH